MNTLVSSANSFENNKSDDLEKSLIYKLKRRGPSMDPWGIHVDFFLSEWQSLYSTNCSLKVK